MIGSTLGRYRILEKIGEGGMGEVYRAHDESLDRDVALKVLPASSFSDQTARARLLREARTASQLNHPHICTIHEVGEADGQVYIAMELVEGQPLSARLVGEALRPEDILRYGLQLAEAMSHAHDRGIVHRDLKSANVIITPEGRAKVLDFGLAKRLSENELDEATRSQASLTAPGTLAGTLPYMAPEQLRGQPADARSDIWALGVVLYEMAAGARPFQGRTGFELSSAILHQSPTPLPSQVPIKLRAVIDRCLEKEPGRRYQRAGEVRAAIEAIQAGAVSPWVAWHYALARRRWLMLAAAVAALAAILLGLNAGGLRTRLSSSPPRIQSLAVLPLENLSRDPEQDYFADGMHEALINNLAQIRALKVISRTSVVRYKESRKALPEIARELGVDALIEGSVQRAGRTVRISVRLINGATDGLVWSGDYEGDEPSVLKLQAGMARDIGSEIRAKLTPAEDARLASARPVNPEAYEAYLKGRYHLKKLTEEGFRKAAEYFQKAIEIDPTYALAYAGLADTYSLTSLYSELVPIEAMPKARTAALKAVELDEMLGEGHEALASVKLFFDWDWAGAEHELKRALQLSPNSAEVYGTWNLFLVSMGRFDESIAAAKRAIELDPLSVTPNLVLGWTYYYAGRHDESIAQLQKTLELDPNLDLIYMELGWDYSAKGMHSDAVNACKKAIELGPDDQLVLGSCGRVFGVAGRRQEALELLKKLNGLGQRKYLDPYNVASLYDGLGDKENALEWFERAYSVRSANAQGLKIETLSQNLRSDPRFQDLLRRMNFPK